MFKSSVSMDIKNKNINDKRKFPPYPLTPMVKQMKISVEQ